MTPMKRYKRCPKCANPDFACTCPKPPETQPSLAFGEAESPKASKPESGYFLVQPVEPNVFSTASMLEIVQQLEACGYRCEAGPLEHNIAFIELKRRALLEEAS